MQAVKQSVRRREAAGAFPPGYQALVQNGLARERDIVIAILRTKVERDGLDPSAGEWEEMVSRAITTARSRWPKPVGGGTAA